ncbi:MAG: hypothetical protein AAFZ15_17350 [Bacteroidota bacterium]
MLNHLEIAVVSSELLPGYGDDSVQIGIEKTIVDGWNQINPALAEKATIEHFNRVGQEAINAVGCNNCVVIIDRTNFNIVWQRPFNSITSSKIKKALEDALQLSYDQATGTYKKPGGGSIDPIVPGSNTGSNSLIPGLGLFDLNLNLPWWVFAAIAAGSAWQFNKSQSTVGKLIFGGVSLVAGANAYKKKQLE